MADWKDVLGSVAPGLATALGGPLAGAAVKVIADKVLGNPSASQEDVIQALSSGGLTGDQMLALKNAEHQFKLEMEKIDAGRDAADLQDTQSAREQTIALAEADSSIAWAAPIVSVVVVLGFFGCVALLFMMERTWDERTSNLLNVLFGALIPGFTQVLNYWMGSSAGSKRSGDAVRKLAEKKANH